jgi:aspartyl-tRNA(Asn)/glutamyl-tRNA(Gln) amidotransferase subunit C
VDSEAARIELVRRAAALARLELAPTEEALLAAGVARILEHLRVLEEVDVTGVEPMTGATSIHDVTRPDEPRAIEIELPLLDAAPAERDGFYVVPKTVGSER